MAALADRPVRVVLADDHELVRAGIRKLLEAIAGVQVVAEAGDGAGILRELQASQADLVVADLGTAAMELTAIEQIRILYPHLRILVLSMHADTLVVRRAMAAGASGYVSKDAPEFELDQAVHSVMRTGSYISPSVARRLLQPPEPSAAEELTKRQLEILTLLAQGRAPKEIGFQLGLSARTVDAHRGRIMQRLQIYDLASLVRYAVRKGLVRP